MLSLLLLFTSQSAPKPETLTPTEYLVIAAGARAGRTPVRTDPVEALIVSGQWQTPEAGQKLPGTQTAWEKVAAGKDGSISHRALRGGYALWKVESPTPRTMVLEARGHGLVYVNGQPRAGDPYGHGYLAIPVQLKQGLNQFLFAGGRGAITPTLRPPTGVVEIAPSDATLPDLVENRQGSEIAGVVVRNCSPAPLADALLTATLQGATRSVKIPPVPAHGLFKVPFQFDHPSLPKGPAKLEVTVTSAALQARETATFPLEVKPPQATRKSTFQSGIEGSAQYYGLVPATTNPPSAEKPGLILSLHGAGVEGIGQAATYSPKPWAHVVAPTNRRAFGFDWEDWGRMDALEVLDLNQKKLDTDPAKTWLTGHSMGGHGTWHIGVTFPDRFGAIAPSAGWISMFSYAGAKRAEPRSPVEQILNRASNTSDTLGLVRNIANRGVYILHGDADDNVPVDQARTMRSTLADFHPDFAYHEQPGAGHWWGNACVDWPPLTRFLSEHPRPAPEASLSIDFRTFHPGISSRMAWAEIHTQAQWGQLSSIQLKADPAGKKITGTTANVTRLALRNPGWPQTANWSLSLDSQTIPLTPFEKDQPIHLVRAPDGWKTQQTPPPADSKKPGRAGPLKEALRRNMVYLVGTAGPEEETQANWQKARYDAEVFYYRGNGAIEIRTDTDWLQNPAAFKGRNLVLVGNEDNNQAMAALLKTSPLRVRRGKIEWPGKSAEGPNLAAVFVRPMPDDPDGSIVIQAGTGPEGIRLNQRLSLWLSGSSFPDFFVYNPTMLQKGPEGILTTGYFDSNWQWSPDQTNNP